MSLDPRRHLLIKGLRRRDEHQAPPVGIPGLGFGPPLGVGAFAGSRAAQDQCSRQRAPPLTDLPAAPNRPAATGSPATGMKRELRCETWAAPATVSGEPARHRPLGGSVKAAHLGRRRAKGVDPRARRPARRGRPSPGRGAPSETGFTRMTAVQSCAPARTAGRSSMVRCGVRLVVERRWTGMKRSLLAATAATAFAAAAQAADGAAAQVAPARRLTRRPSGFNGGRGGRDGEPVAASGGPGGSVCHRAGQGRDRRQPGRSGFRPSCPDTGRQPVPQWRDRLQHRLADPRRRGGPDGGGH